MSLPVIPEQLQLEGYGIRLRHPEPKDLAFVREQLSDKKTMAHLRYMSHEADGGWSLEQIKERHERRSRGQKEQQCIQWVVEELNGTVVGTCGYPSVALEHHRGEFGIILHHPYWGGGRAIACHLLGLEYGFTQLKLHRIEFLTFVKNVRARQFLERFGAQLEGIRRECVYEVDHYEDHAAYTLFAAQWPEAKAKLLQQLKH